ncbi:Phosphatidic acid phosphatase type 2/haloperoxidase domain-containing protein [Strongyloides ratti]|uniref:Phosphatidic acid phosphatase type 2/haloperoxidase domain-containing protein n=1 Tax=Strongyloides ratti TaxID=34506 RepID=A0A090LNL1_STRRB|nr:Phosphatidic acid phosphatase type 2/haloperoxidase domain-containing protein [Strongyloides ratti]CEF69744.1 Phosphatidic acid phosphatase type 2/haloperoxidase domain-containing protein [Strongyloides ratti]
MSNIISINLFPYSLSGRYYKKWNKEETIDVAVTLIILILIYNFGVRQAITPTIRGFSCSDTSIRNEFYINTISTKHLLFVTLALPFPVIIGSIFINNLRRNIALTPSAIAAQTSYFYLHYIIIYFFMTVGLEIIKCKVGRLRPHFITVCQPDLSICDKNPNAWIDEITCNTTTRRDRNIRSSFPSGHAAAAVFATFYVFNFVRTIIKSKALEAVIFKYGIISSYIVWTFICAITRITDFWHFTSD